MGRVLAIGDIHGCLTALETLERFVPFREDDTIVTLGDYVDRGPDSRGVIDWLLDRRFKYNMVCLKGNHEQMMLDARRDRSLLLAWMYVGGEETLLSYGISETTEDVPEEHWAFLEGLPFLHETETHYFVHGNVAPYTSFNEVDDRVMWEAFTFSHEPHVSGKMQICGHTAQRNGQIARNDRAICIDTCAYGGQWLTCLDPMTGHYWQANQKKESRFDILD